MRTAGALGRGWGEARRKRRGRQRGTQLTLLPSKAEIEPLPPVPCPCLLPPSPDHRDEQPRGVFAFADCASVFPTSSFCRHLGARGRAGGLEGTECKLCNWPLWRVHQWEKGSPKTRNWITQSLKRGGGTQEVSFRRALSTLGIVVSFRGSRARRKTNTVAIWWNLISLFVFILILSFPPSFIVFRILLVFKSYLSDDAKVRTWGVYFSRVCVWCLYDSFYLKHK